MTTAVVNPLGAKAFAPNALFAYWDGRGEETAARTTARGRAEIEPVLTRWAGAEVTTTVRAGRDCFVEGRLSDGATFVASLQLDDQDAIARCLAFHCPAVEPSSVSGHATPTQVRACRLLELYFANLTAGQFIGAARCFSEDCLYSHPPYVAGAERAEFRGCAALLAGFENVRGPRPSRLPRILVCAQDGPDCFIEGVVDGDPPRGSFVSSVTLDAEGLICRYVAFYTDSRVPRA